MSDQRQQQLQVWLEQQLPDKSLQLTPLAGDASFRRYFRLNANGQSYIVMDAPPERENCVPYVSIAKTLREHGLLAPEVFAEDLAQGFLLLSDFGDQLLLDALTPETADKLYKLAFENLIKIQKIRSVSNYELPVFERGLYSYREEMQWLEEWYFNQHRARALKPTEQKALNETIQLVADAIKEQPLVFVHRDYHSRNLMLTGDQQLGILDFQDAVFGPVSYDVMSLLRDCYIDWPADQVDQWVFDYHDMAYEAGVLKDHQPEQFLRWFDWAGLQRNLKCIGLFARLNIRDNKPGYLQDIPRVMGYAKWVCSRYPEFSALGEILAAHE